jgi:hypothetical protein
MVTAKLVFGAAVGGTHIEKLEFRSLGLDAKGHADEASRRTAGARGWGTRKVHFDSAVLEFRSGDDRQGFNLLRHGRRGKVDGLVPSVIHRLGPDVAELELVEGLETSDVLTRSDPIAAAANK